MRVSLVLARSEEGTSDARGLSMFLIERDETVKIRRIEEKLGIHGSPTCEMQFDGTKALLIGKRKMGLIKYVMELMNGARLGIAGQAIGIAEAAYREALKYAHDRKQFLKSIIEFPAVYDMLTSMRMKIEAARVLTYFTSMMVDYKKIFTERFDHDKDASARDKMKYYTSVANTMTPIAKFYSTEMSNQVTYDAIQIHGGDGYMKDYNVERHYRDARITNIYEGTTQLQVVAAIGGIISGDVEKEMDNLEALVHETQFNKEKDMVKAMRRQLAEMVLKYKEMDEEEKAYNARRIVNVATHIIISYLMINDGQKSGRKETIARAFTRNAVGFANADHYAVMNSHRYVIDEKELIYSLDQE